MGEVGFRALLVMLDRADVSAIGNTDDNGHGHATLVATGHLGQLGGDLIEPGKDESVELDLADGAVPPKSQPDRCADDARLGERCVENAPLAEFGLKPLCHSKDTTERTDVLAHKQHFGIVGECFAEPRIECLREGKLVSHQAVPPRLAS